MKDPEATPQNMNASLGLQQQLANNIKAGEQLVQDYRKQVSALREKAAKERATVGDLHRTAVHMKIELETKKRELGGLNALLAMAKREHDNAAQEMPPSASENQISTATAEMSQPPDVRSGSDAQATACADPVHSRHVLTASATRNQKNELSLFKPLKYLGQEAIDTNPHR